MTERLQGKTAIITGATEGVGHAAALLFAREGARVLGTGRSTEKGERLLADAAAAGLEDLIAFEVSDAARPDDVERAVAATVERFGGLDILYANVGLMSTGAAADISLKEWHEGIRVNLDSAFYLAHFGIPHLLERGGGVVITTAGELGQVAGSNMAPYCAAKAGVIQLTRTLAADYSRRGIRANCLCPGAINTPLLRRWFDGAEDPERLRAAQLDPILLGRAAEPDEIARAALYLASDDSSYMTGAMLTVDGGLTASYGL